MSEKDSEEISNSSKDASADPEFKELLVNLKEKNGIEVGKILGKGSFSVVAKGVHQGKDIAIKIIDTRSQSEYVKRFLPRETRLVMSIHHECLMRVHEVVNLGSYVSFLSELCDGGDLLQKILRMKRIPEDASKVHFRQLIEALSYLQQKEIVHRDLKCENVFLDKHDNVKLGDFGFARILRKGEETSTFCGSRAYVAPEILRAIKYSGQTADIWSAGIVLYVMVTGVMPYDDRNPTKMVERQLAHKIRFPRSLDLSNNVKVLIYDILHPLPQNRPTYDAMCKHPWLKDTPYVIAGPKVEKVSSAESGALVNTYSNASVDRARA